MVAVCKFTASVFFTSQESNSNSNSNPTTFRLTLYRGNQFLARTIETHSGSIQVESIRPSLTEGTLSHCSSILMSLTDTLSHIGPKPRLSITVLNLSPYKEIYQRIQFLARTFVTHSGSIQVESIRPSLKPGTLSHC